MKYDSVKEYADGRKKARVGNIIYTLDACDNVMFIREAAWKRK